MILTIEESNNSEPRTIDLDQTGKTSWLIGRSPDCDVPLSPSLMSVSRRHATLKYEGGWYRIQVHSANGICIDGKELSGNSYNFVFDDQHHSYKITLGDAEEGANLTLSYTTNAVMIPNDALEDIFSREDNLKQLMAFERKIHEQILAELHLAEKLGSILGSDEKTVQSVKQKLEEILKEEFNQIPGVCDLVDEGKKKVFETIKEEIFNNIMRLGPITPLLDDPDVDEVMVNAYNMIFIEKKGVIEQIKDVQFYDNEQLLSVIQRIATKVGREITIANPMVDARLEDGSRVNAIIPPLALDGPSLTIRKFKNYVMTTQNLIEYGTMNEEMADFLENAVKSRQNILISGGTGSGKTTLLNVLGEFIPQNERLVVIEDSAELRLTHVNKVRLEARPANIQGQGEVTIRKLLVNSLRMRPDRIIIGECRAGEALDMLQAMNTGHNGSLTTVHANSPRDALSRLENMVLMAGVELPVSAIREQTASAINLIIQQNRLPDGSRKIVEIAEITGRQGDTILIQPLYTFEETGIDANGKIVGKFVRKLPAKFQRNPNQLEQGNRTGNGAVSNIPPEAK